MNPALIDNSAWARITVRLPSERRQMIGEALERRLLWACLPFVLEAGYSARSAADHRIQIEDLLALPFAPLDERVEQRAFEGQGQLAAAGHHRLAPVDIMIAALADVYRLDILHYDADFDRILEHTDLSYGSVWLAPRGSL